MDYCTLVKIIANCVKIRNWAYLLDILLHTQIQVHSIIVLFPMHMVALNI